MNNPSEPLFEPGDVVVFCDELMSVEANRGTTGQVLFLSGELCSNRHQWVLEGESTRYATREELEPLVAKFPLARIGLARLNHRISKSGDLLDSLMGTRPGVQPDTTIGVGHRVRAFDFGSTDTCYAEGVVEEITVPVEGCPRYKLRVERRVFDGKEQTSFEEYVYPPVNGAHTTTGRLTNLVARVK